MNLAMPSTEIIALSVLDEHFTTKWKMPARTGLASNTAGPAARS